MCIQEIPDALVFILTLGPAVTKALDQPELHRMAGPNERVAGRPDIRWGNLIVLCSYDEQHRTLVLCLE